MKTLILTIFLITTSAMATEINYEPVMRARMGQLGKVLSDKAIQAEVIKDGFDLVEVWFVEADDGNTEPLYVIKAGKVIKGTFVPKCFTVMFDTDKPDTPASLYENVDACTY